MEKNDPLADCEMYLFQVTLNTVEDVDKPFLLLLPGYGLLRVLHRPEDRLCSMVEV
ncbi:hypothetical protein D3C76_1500600 [compost metagenome]